MSRSTTQNIYTQVTFFINAKQVFITNFNCKKNIVLLFLLNFLDFITWIAVKQF